MSADKVVSRREDVERREERLAHIRLALGVIGWILTTFLIVALRKCSSKH